jgi:uncharacterized protein (TIGR02646 family)
MRRLSRPDLEPALAGYLDRLQRTVDDGGDVEEIWKTERRRQPMGRVARVLGSVTGPRERCMYCEDSRGTDIEHFWPRRYREHVFSWLNLLWVCTGCNRCKSNRFPCDALGVPLLINPTAEDPWDFLFYDSRTDELTARWHRATGDEDPKGKNTVAVLSTLRHQAVTEGRRRVRRHLQRTVQAFLYQIRQEGTEREVECTESFLEAVSEHSEHGLAQWFFLRDGQEDAPFSDLRRDFPDVWARIVGSLA